jgi:hypothetical protein
MKFSNGRWRTQAHVAHICGLKKTSARFDESIPVPERNNFRNLLLLCKPHHDDVDDNALEDLYPKELLISWKTTREGDYADDLLELGSITEDDLRELMTEAVSDTRDEIARAFDRMNAMNNDFLASLKQAALDFFDLPYLDPEDIKALHYTATVFRAIPDYAEMLNSSAHKLRHLSNTTDVLSFTAHELRSLPGTTDVLSYVAHELRSLPGAVDELSIIARDLEKLPSTVDGLSFVARDLRTLPDSADILSVAASAINNVGLAEFVSQAREIESSVRSLTVASSELMEATKSIGPMTDTSALLQKASERLERAASAVRSRVVWSWATFGWGAATCAIFVIVLLFLWSHILIRK